MKIISRNLKAQKVRLKIETPDDLWHLERILQTGDLVTSRTMRKTSIKRGGDYEYGDKKPVVLTVSAEKVEFREDSGTLKITGPIVSGPEDVPKQSYHSLQVDVGTVLTIGKKEWKKHELQRLKKAGFKKPLVLVCVLDREGADFAVLRESGVEMKASITNYDRENMEEYYKEIISYISKRSFETLVIAGPGFERENLMKFVRANHKKLAKKCIVEHSSSTGISGVNEVIKKSASRILKETRIAKESSHVDELLKRIKKDGMVVYGPEETRKAISMGAVETLFVSQARLRESEDIMESQEKMRGEVVIIGDDHEMGERFLHLGGIAGFLRFKTRA